jgi:predicted transcriptional regulator
MSVNTVCNHNVATIQRDAGIVEAAARMRAEHVGDLIVVEQRAGKLVPIGILTDRDIVVAVVAKGIVPNAVTVGDAMSSELLTIHQDNGIEYALREMRRAGVRRAPVVDQGDALVAVLSIDDVIDHLAVQLGHMADIIRLEQQTEADERV